MTPISTLLPLGCLVPAVAGDGDTSLLEDRFKVEELWSFFRCFGLEAGQLVTQWILKAFFPKDVEMALKREEIL